MTSALRSYLSLCTCRTTVQVAELIAGLQGLGCTRTMGEDQTLCVMSDSFNANGFASLLQSFGDLPVVDVVKVRMKTSVVSFAYYCTWVGTVACSKAGPKI